MPRAKFLISWTNKGNGGSQEEQMDRQEVSFLIPFIVPFHFSYLSVSRTIQLSTDHLKTDCYVFVIVFFFAARSFVYSSFHDNNERPLVITRILFYDKLFPLFDVVLSFCFLIFLFYMGNKPETTIV